MSYKTALAVSIPLKSGQGCFMLMDGLMDGLCVFEQTEGNAMHTFLRSDGKVLHSDTFMRGPKAGAGKVWNRRYDNVWVEEDSPHGPESNPNHISYDLHIFGEHHESFMRRQYK